MTSVFIVSVLLLVAFIRDRFLADEISFPEDFRFGVSTSAYQIEGAWELYGKGESIWDRLTHTQSEVIVGQSNGDVACDSFHLYERDLEMLAELGVDFYRFSIAWTRIYPSGYTNGTNQAGIDYYNNLIDGLLARGITPFVTMYHWDLPQPLDDLGGWTNEAIIEYFVDYADLLFRLYGDRVKEWTTINEPYHVCFGYSSNKNAPMKGGTGVADYMCAHNILKAHARVYHLYDEIYRPHQQGEVVICIDSGWFEPETQAAEDLEASEKTIQFILGWFAHPIFSETGDYPPVMREIVDRKSLQQGFKRSRLPYFTRDEIDYIKGTSDFFSLNHYSTRIVYGTRKGPVWPVPSHEDDYSYSGYQPEWFPSSALNTFKIVPWGFRNLLKWIKNEYNNPTIIVAENGCPINSEYPDENRIVYLRSYLNALWEAIEDGSDIRGYSVWSLMDNFEWLNGYNGKFGLFHVDFDVPNKTRTIRKSGQFYANLSKTHNLNVNFHNV